jgi:hypothetical protein
MTEKVECPDCHRRVAVRKDGTLWTHQQWVGGTTQFPPRCDRSGKRP